MEGVDSRPVSWQGVTFYRGNDRVGAGMAVLCASTILEVYPTPVSNNSTI